MNVGQEAKDKYKKYQKALAQIKKASKIPILLN